MLKWNSKISQAGNVFSFSLDSEGKKDKHNMRTEKIRILGRHYQKNRGRIKTGKGKEVSGRRVRPDKVNQEKEERIEWKKLGEEEAESVQGREERKHLQISGKAKEK